MNLLIAETLFVDNCIAKTLYSRVARVNFVRKLLDNVVDPQKEDRKFTEMEEGMQAWTPDARIQFYMRS